MNSPETEDNFTQVDRSGLFTNLEIVAVYYRMKHFYDNLNEDLKQGRIEGPVVDVPLLGPRKTYRNVSEEDVRLIKSSDYYKTGQQLIEKLSRYVEIIEDCDDDVKKVLNQFK